MGRDLGNLADLPQVGEARRHVWREGGEALRRQAQHTPVAAWDGK
jgi:hypothetical protein